MTSPPARAHDVLTAVLVAAIVPDPAGRHRRTADFAQYVPHQQRADAVMRRLAPALSVASMGSGLLAVGALARRDPAAAAWRAVSVAAVAGAIALTVRVHVPFNRQLRTWAPQQEVPGWREGRARWERAHHARRGLVVLAGAAALAARR
ncbi:anthrone oxygenase family protein [Kineococcus esterisolvens]|uniref:anthrone oxygenase family protein n=1 Tax=unclassified Kineococcus TaxID=2621656 RepID=UPI003D7D1850